MKAEAFENPFRPRKPLTWDDLEADAYSKADTHLDPGKASQVRKLGSKAFAAARASGKAPKEDSVTRKIRKASGK